MSALASLFVAALGSPASAVPLWDAVRPAAVCRMSGSWIIGLGHPQASVTNVNIERISTAGREHWQALHRGVVSAATGDDMFLVDAATLHPVETRHSGPVPPVQFRFNGSEATKISVDGSAEEAISIGGAALPEGPGLEIIVQAIAWREGLAVQGVMLDRWRGNGMGRVRNIRWSVEGRELRETLSGAHQVYRTRLEPTDGSFAITAFVTAGAPHHIVRYEYVAAPGRAPLISEMREAAFYCGRLPAEPIDRPDP